jgi:hypothetical protein
MTDQPPNRQDTPPHPPLRRAGGDRSEHSSVNMADLVRSRRELGVTHRRRSPSMLARLFTRKG